MPRFTVEPHTTVTSLQDLFMIAAEVENRTGAAYSGIAARMRAMGRTDLAALLDELAEDAGRRARQALAGHDATGGKDHRSVRQSDEVMAIFDDEGAAWQAPELFTAYRLFAMAVRNSERVFSFWTYIAAHSALAEVNAAAEQMARDELARSATLRRARRRAFHEDRATADTSGRAQAIAAQEIVLADLLVAQSRQAASADEASRLHKLADAARARAAALEAAPLATPQPVRHVLPQVEEHCRPAAEFLLDWYLDLAQQLPAEDDRARAQDYAGELLHCLSDLQPAAKP
jgi:hypothetical protein